MQALLLSSWLPRFARGAIRCGTGRLGCKALQAVFVPRRLALRDTTADSSDQTASLKALQS